jgi:hypothetical protein
MSTAKITYAIIELTAGRDRTFAAGYPTRGAAEQAAAEADIVWYRGYRIAEQHSSRCRCERCTTDPWERQLAAMAA